MLLNHLGREMKYTVKLSIFERRCDMTSRECASVLGGVIGGLVRAHGLIPVRESVIFAAKVCATDNWNVEAPKECSKPALTVIAATFIALYENATPGSAIDALTWWAEHEEAWAPMMLAVERPS